MLPFPDVRLLPPFLFPQGKDWTLTLGLALLGCNVTATATAAAAGVEDGVSFFEPSALSSAALASSWTPYSGVPSTWQPFF